MTTIAWWLFAMAPMRVSFREASWREVACLCLPWTMWEAALESGSSTALPSSPTLLLVLGTTLLFSNKDRMKCTHFTPDYSFKRICQVQCNKRLALLHTEMLLKGTRNQTENWVNQSTTFTTSSTPCSMEPALCLTLLPMTPSLWLDLMISWLAP